MKYLRHLAAVLLVVAVVVVGGIAWERASGTDHDERVDRPPSGSVVVVGPPEGSRPIEYKNLVRTTLVETLIMTVVVGTSSARHRRRRARRAAAGVPQ